MPVNLDAIDVDARAQELYRLFRLSKNKLNTILTDLNTDNYNRATEIPEDFKDLDEKYQDIIGLGVNTQLKTALDTRYSATFTLSEFASYRNSMETLANFIEKNFNLMTPTINATSKKPEYVTSPGTSQKV